MKRVLVADDSATMRHLLRLIVAKYLPCPVEEAADGLEALERVRSGGFDLVITDINMPRPDGLGLIDGIRRQLGSDVSIIVVTTKGGETDRAPGLALGADAYLTPLQGVAVGRTLAALLG